METLTANIFNIQPMSTEDGPGIRTTVFMKGCNLRCIWCQNPEGLSKQVHLVHDALRCIGCDTCLKSCPNGAFLKGAAGLQFSGRCKRCLACAASCPARAIRVIGETITLDELVRKLLRDKPFYDQSGGGVTFSGGECLLQPDFLRAAVCRLKEAGVHVCIDTAGCISPAIFQAAVREADLLLYDLKVMDDRRHRETTGFSNQLILENAAWLGRSGLRTWVRVPVVPGYTDSDANMEAIAQFLKRQMPGVERVDLLGYNDLCAGDYTILGLDYALKEALRVEEEAMLRYREILSLSGAGLVSISNYRKGE